MATTGNATSILVLGGGVGGLVAANRLRRRLAAPHRVVMLEREMQHTFAPSLLWVLTGDRQPERIARPLERLCRRGIEIVRGEVECIDPAAREVVVGGRTWRGDALVIALGVDLVPEQVPGLAEAGHNLYTTAGASAFRRDLVAMKEGRIALLTAAPAYKCPAAPYEAAMLVESDLRRRGVRNRVNVDLYAAEPGPMGVAGPAITAAVRGMVEAKGIGYHPEHQVTSVGAGARTLKFANGAAAQFDLLGYVPLHRAPKVVRDAGLVGENGWIAVDRQTMLTKFPGVYAIGDVTSIPLTMGKPLPKAGVFAHGQAEVVADNIVADIEGHAQTARFDGHGGCFVEIGDGRAGFGAGNFYGEPSPAVRLRPPSRLWHWGKVAFERRWLWGRF